ncbi:GvpL/GvpF family gas vesicle protein [Falsibacillus pallidus]|uniref:Gas vesicle protein GvpL/GvpF n=1 Tax=Falsibacillus pallidus TaxID=493781 RepID=A0A370GQJ3_9BACI|nr:GvpL/GvpF family gas vesicle protein [Falsibacillus pallidus]RDI45972.1 gas vesicle protein GvpL/GvpF [Falsibacillus pallidus]
MDRLIYVYGLVPHLEMEEKPLSTNIPGFEGEPLQSIDCGEVTAVISGLNAEFNSEEALKDKMENDMEWLQEKAFHHHETILALYKNYTIIPLKFCTIYKNEENLLDEIRKKQESLKHTFTVLQGNEEWNLKIYCDDNVFKNELVLHHSEIEEKRSEIASLSPGRQFFEKRKLDQLVEKEIEAEKTRICENIHARLMEFSVHAAVKKNWSKDMTGTQEKMAWNSVFLIDSNSVDRFQDIIRSQEESLKEKGWRLEATGPWPAYHFSSFS